jgi:hypothetical protein
MHHRIGIHEKSLLRKILAQYASERVDLFAGIETNEFTEGQRREICDFIGLEFAHSGTQPDLEPTDHGLELERLLDLFNRPTG